MRKAIAALAFVVCFVAVPVLAGAPANGAFFSATGQVLEGRFSEAYIGGGQGQVGNTVHALSWDGGALGTQWGVFCPVLEATPVLIENARDANGNGHLTWRSTYRGGTFWLSGTGDWAGGDPFYTGIVYDYVHTTTMHYVAWVMVGYDTNAQLKGLFDIYESCIMLTIANATLVGMNGIPPADYPVLKSGGPSGPTLKTGKCDVCDDAVDVLGEWGDVSSITLVINNCGLSTEQTTWGGVKSLYR
jgi:hypothetical protein